MNKSRLEKQNKAFFDKLSQYYDRGIFGRFISNVAVETLKSVRLNKKAVVLDAGCGSGNLLALLEKRKDLRLYGIDISEGMLEIAREKTRKSKILNLSVLSLSKKFKKEFFDYIFVIDAFHHFPDHKKVLKRFYGLLKRNGRLIVTDVDFGYFFNYFFHLLEPGNVWVYNAKSMKELFEEQGFVVERQKRFGLFFVITVGVKR